MGGVTLKTQAAIQAIPEGAIPAFQLFRVGIERRMKAGEIDLTRDSSEEEKNQEQEEQNQEQEEQNQESGAERRARRVPAFSEFEKRREQQNRTGVKATEDEIDRANSAASLHPDLAKRVLNIIGRSSVPKGEAERMLNDLNARGEITDEETSGTVARKEVQDAIQFSDDADPCLHATIPQAPRNYFLKRGQIERMKDCSKKKSMQPREKPKKKSLPPRARSVMNGV